jgi:hypothetical protein
MSWILDQNQIHITVGSSIQMKGDEPDLENDLQMVKAALLYSDHAKLVSLSSFALLEVANEAEMSKGDRLPFLKKHLAWETDAKIKDQIRKVIELYDYARRRKYTRRGQKLLRDLDLTLADMFRNKYEDVELWISRLGVDGIVEAVGSGLLDIYSFAPMTDRIRQQKISADDVTMEYITAVSEVVSDAHTYPLFDEETGDIVSSQVSAGIIPVANSQVKRSKEVALAADLLARLPLFERASIKEILDIRLELEKPLRSFRSALVKFSDQIQSSSWDKDFAQDADQVFRSDVAPAVLALEDEERSNTFLNKLTAKVAEKSIQLGSAASTSAAISALAVRMLNLPLADVAALAAGPAIVAGGVAYSAYREWREQQEKTEGNSLFFYYKAGSLLESRSFEYEDSKRS